MGRAAARVVDDIAPCCARAEERAAARAIGADLRRAAEARDEGPPSMVELKRRVLLLDTELLRVRLGKLKEQLVDVDVVHRQVFQFARQVRDAWLNWPREIAPQLAATWGIEPERVQRDLEEAVHRKLSLVAAGELGSGPSDQCWLSLAASPKPLALKTVGLEGPAPTSRTAQPPQGPGTAPPPRLPGR